MNSRFWASFFAFRLSHKKEPTKASPAMVPTTGSFFNDRMLATPWGSKYTGVVRPGKSPIRSVVVTPAWHSHSTTIELIHSLVVVEDAAVDKVAEVAVVEDEAVETTKETATTTTTTEVDQFVISVVRKDTMHRNGRTELTPSS